METVDNDFTVGYNATKVTRMQVAVGMTAAQLKAEHAAMHLEAGLDC
ncbi:hypothetical protein MPLSOD_410051 [Mesorhizobium sp. SOD10]|nr:hypothetical protein MPLSOD_410051 [Mesorhizobium sp. SOD10]